MNAALLSSFKDLYLQGRSIQCKMFAEMNSFSAQTLLVGVLSTSMEEFQKQLRDGPWQEPIQLSRYRAGTLEPLILAHRRQQPNNCLSMVAPFLVGLSGIVGSAVFLTETLAHFITTRKTLRGRFYLHLAA